MVRWITIFLSVAGLSVGIWAVMTAKEPEPDLPLARPAAINPYQNGISALGVIEPSQRSVGIVAPEAGLIVEVFVDVNDPVDVGTPLFRLDSRRIEADLIRANAAVQAAQAEITRFHALPRPEDVPPIQAAVDVAKALLQDREDQLRVIQETIARGSGTDRDLARNQFLVQAAKAEYERALAELTRTKAGGWAPDLTVLTGRVEALQAEVQAMTLLKDRLTVKASKPGKVLRRTVEPGEFASLDSTRPAMVIGDLTQLNIRAQIDEEDIGLLTQVTGSALQGMANKPRATARTRGANSNSFELELVRIEPFARAKSDLGGANLERVDTRVIDVIFFVKNPPAAPLFPGQAVDVFIEGQPKAPQPQ